MLPLLPLVSLLPHVLRSPARVYHVPPGIDTWEEAQAFIDPSWSEFEDHWEEQRLKLNEERVATGKEELAKKPYVYFYNQMTVSDACCFGQRHL